MTNKLKAKIIAAHANRAYVKNPFLVITDDDIIEDFIKILEHQRMWGSLDYFHLNHFVLECEEGLYIGFNDGSLYVGTSMTSFKEAETSKASFKLVLVF